MVNTTRTKSGRKKLKEILLLKNLPSKEVVNKKQKAIKELGEKVTTQENSTTKTESTPSSNSNSNEKAKKETNQNQNKTPTDPPPSTNAHAEWIMRNQP